MSSPLESRRAQRARRVRLGVPLALLAVLVGCRAQRASWFDSGWPRHLVIVTIDTLRADRLGAYGRTDVATPHLDALARDGTLALDATVHVPLTRPSHASLFTGRYPAEHGIRDNVSPALADDVPTLAGLLEGDGFLTAAFVSSIVLSKQSGLGRGFGLYHDRFARADDDTLFLNTLQVRGDETTGEAVGWLEAQDRSRHRLAVWLHLYDPHDPYEPPEPYATQYAGRPYDGEVAWTDELIGRLVSALQRLEMLDETLIVVTSDHGEGLGEHGENGHGFFVYESTLQVPLILHGPTIAAGQRLTDTVRTIDVLPTVLDLLGVDRSRLTLPGRSIASAARGEEAAGEVSTYAESLTPLLHFGWSDLRVLRDGRWKYILAPRPELYDLQQDPLETRDLVASQPQRARALRTALEARLRTEQAENPRDQAAAVPPELLEQLGALGYVSPGPPRDPESIGADPKDKIEEFKVVNRTMREGLTRLRAEDFPGSVERLQELLDRGIDSFEVNYYLGRALMGLKRFAPAEQRFARATELLPAYGPAYLARSDALIAQNRLTTALEVVRAGLEAVPETVDLRVREGELWKRQGNLPRAIQAYEAVLPLAPTDALTRVRLGELYRDAGDADRAVTMLQEAVGLDPGPASYWNSLGMVLGGTGRLEEAKAAFEEALSRDDQNAQYAYNLGLVLVRAGRGPDAVAYFQKTLALDPGFRPARERLAELSAR